MKTLRELFGEKVRALRRARKLTQEKLGEKVGLHPTYVGSVERGETNLSMHNVEKFAKALGVEPVELFTFASKDAAATDKDKILLEISALLDGRDEKDLGRVLRILREVVGVE